jgi:putative AdoMet-dependent methyltransferase
MTTPDPFPPEDFDSWAETYDQSLREGNDFPFAGYDEVLQTILSLAEPKPGQSILDLGTGTANLALLFAQHGCELTCTDFSPVMLDIARTKLPQAQFVQHDLRGSWPAELDRRFDCIVSAYVFHHFELEQKIRICSDLLLRRLAPGGHLIIGDLSFPSFVAKESFKQHIPDWEEELYWFADEAIAGLREAGLTVDYRQISPCAGIYHMRGSSSF